MTKYEQLLSECEQIDVQERNMKNKGLYGDSTIWINKKLSEAEKLCILAEEMGHHYTTSGDILNQNDIGNRKQERAARGWAYDKIVPLENIKQAYCSGYSETWEIAEYLDVDEQFLKEAMQYYKEKYGDELLREHQELEF
ncbi:MAG: ImmA/IrrE family metallo-endopeptidase [Firmicutes bacterium]|jgi:hypothetical protein|nr:ImmA/IrrE family metallo-endopeptidase [Bacillota bacterium]